MSNVSQSQANSEFNLPPVLKPQSSDPSGRRSVEDGSARRSAEGGSAKRSVELPPFQSLAEPKAPVQPPEAVQPTAKPAGKAGKKPAKSKPKPNAKSQGTVRKLLPEPPPYPPNSGGNRADAFLSPAAAQIKRLPKLTVPSVKLPEIPLPPLPAFLKAKQKPWEWSIVWLWSLGAFGGLGLVAFAWMASLPPLPECNAVTRLSPGNERLYCAQERARSGQLPDLVAAMALLNGWSEQEPLYGEVQRSLSEWSSLVLIAARDRMGQNDLKGAIETANLIPQTSSVYSEAQETIAHWQEQWQKGEQAYAAAQAAIQAQNWSDASNWVATLNDLQQDYWRVDQADRLAQQIQVEKVGWQALTKARKLVQSRSTSDLAGAIGLVKDIPPETYVWQAAQADLQQWGRSLLDLAMRQWQQGDLDGAVAAAQQVPLSVPLPPEVQDLVKFSHAARQVAQGNGDASWQQIWNLMEGIASMGQIGSGSPLYAQAQAKQQSWTQQFEDGVQLQWANLGARLGQRSTLNWAIEQAQPLVSQSSMTAQAQGRVTAWQQQIQILEDKPILNAAGAIAAKNTIPHLQQAIVSLQQIPADRATWSETQRLTAQWQQQIQILEDQPIWDEAQALAQREQYAEAIAVAARIGSSRALYPQAQQAIESWKMAIRSAEMAADRKILDRAKGFAAKGDLTEAIATAAEIAPGREMYLEAQGAIGQWLKQRDGSQFSSGGEESDELF